MAEATRVRRLYLDAIERDDISPLPSRPFAVGYVRAYARALGLDGDTAVARFKTENPEESQALRAPLGVGFERDPRRPVIYAAIAVLVIAIALWNIAQHQLISSARPDAILPASAAAWPQSPRADPVTLGAPTPPPADQTTPKPYVTPGLGVAGIDKNAPAGTDAPASPPVAARPDPPPAAKFTTRAAVYGVPARQGGVLVQARSPASLIVRGSGGQIFFARELEAGEAYRAPVGRGLTADVSDPNAFLLYVGRQAGRPAQRPPDPAGQGGCGCPTAPAGGAVKPPQPASRPAPPERGGSARLDPPIRARGGPARLVEGACAAGCRHIHAIAPRT